MKKQITLILMVSFIMVFVGVGNVLAENSWESNLQSLKGSEITVLVRSGSFYGPGTRAIAKEFTRKTGIKVNINEVGRSGFFSTLTTQLGSRSSDTDVAWFLSVDIPKYASSGALMKLNKYINGKYTAPTFNINKLLGKVEYKDGIYQIPVDISTHYLYYRKDLIKTPPKTWQEYFEMAKEFTRSTNPDSPTKFGAVWPSIPPELARVFAGILFTHGGQVWSEEEGVQINKAPAVEAIKKYIKFKNEDVVPIDLLSWNFNRCKDALESGMVAMVAPYWNAAIGQIRNSDSKYADKIGVAPAPGIKQSDGSIKRVAYQQSWGLVVNSGSENKKAAWAFASYLSSLEGQKLIVEEVGGLTPTITTLLNNPPATKAAAHWKLHLKTLKNAKSFPSRTWLPDVESRISDALIEAISEQRPIQDALDSAAEDSKKIINKN